MTSSSAFSLLPQEILYPPIETDLWVVISRLNELPVRTVPNLELVNHSSEFALPLPTGRVPSKAVNIDAEVQMYDDVGRPLYDDGLGGTVDDEDIDGNPLGPLTETVTEERVVNLRDNANLFTLTEVMQLVESDFLSKYSFYDWSKLVIFDERYDSVSIYEEQQQASGFASGGYPLFLGPFFGIFDSATEPRGHLMVVAPVIDGIDYYFQIRHGVAGVNGMKGPVADIAQASRLANTGDGGEITRLYPLENLQVTEEMLTDAAAVENHYFWIRTGENNRFVQPKPYPTIPFIIVLGKSTGSIS